MTEEQFWAAVEQGQRPSRPQPAPTPGEGPSLDAKLARLLLTKAGLTADDLIGMAPERAVEIWNVWLTTGGRPSDGGG